MKTVAARKPTEGPPLPGPPPQVCGGEGEEARGGSGEMRPEDEKAGQRDCFFDEVGIFIVSGASWGHGAPPLSKPRRRTVNAKASR